MSGYCNYPVLLDAAEKSGIAALAQCFSSPLSQVRDGYIWDPTEKAEEWFYDGHFAPEHAPEYWLLDGDTPILGSLDPRKGLSEAAFRGCLPHMELKPSMKAVYVVPVVGYFQFCLYMGEMEALVAACGYVR